MTYRATHITTYRYSSPVSICHTEVHLAPRTSRAQNVLRHDLMIHPEPDLTLDHRDYFGNQVGYFSIHGPHRTLTITATSLVDVQGAEVPDPSLTPAWEEACIEAANDLDAYAYVFESPRVRLGPAFAAYARPSFTARRPMLEACLELCHRIFTEFRYDKQATTVRTGIEEVLRTKSGVCQDFAHVMIACLRSIGVPARYVSGYLRSGERSIGAEASHAWVSAFCPGFGWMDFDPTNDVMPALRHVTVAWGRDYSDVTPVYGIALGGGEQIVGVEVKVIPA